MALNDVDPQLSSDAATLDLTTPPAPGTTNWLSVTNFGSRITLKGETSQNVPSPTADKPRPYVCPICHRCFKRLEHLKRRERLHTNEKPFECPECTRCFARRDLLLRHRQKLHWTSTPSSRTRKLRESVTSVASVQCRACKSSAAVTATAPNSAAASRRPRPNIAATVEDSVMQAIEPTTASVAHGMGAESSHVSPADFPLIPNPVVFGGGMTAAQEQRGMQHGLPTLDSIWTLPLLATSDPGFDFEKILFTPTSTNPGSLQYHDSPQSMVMDHCSPFGGGFSGVARDNPFADCLDELDWMTTHLTGLEGSSWHVTGYHDEVVQGPGDYIGASRRTTPGEQKQSTNTECIARPAP